MSDLADKSDAELLEMAHAAKSRDEWNTAISEYLHRQTLAKINTVYNSETTIRVIGDIAEAPPVLHKPPQS